MFSDHNRRFSDGHSSHHSDRSRGKPDDPPNSRLFIMCGKHMTEELIKEAFSHFGTIEEIWVLKDLVTQEPKGKGYIKFSKTSAAVRAMEEMNGKLLFGDSRPLKVVIANAKDQTSRRENNEEERLLRLFVMIPRRTTEDELRQDFSRFGTIDNVTIVRDYDTRESKGVAYIKFQSASHAAKAFESCDPSYRAVFAEPKPQNKYLVNDARPVSTMPTVGLTSTAAPAVQHTVVKGQCRLIVNAHPSLTQNQLWLLFDIVPGLDSCRQRPPSLLSTKAENVFLVQFNNIQAAMYAKEKLHGFEYPLGSRLVVKHEVPVPDSQAVLGPPPLPNSKPDAVEIAKLTETIATATALLKTAGYMPAANVEPSVSIANLPPPQPFAHPDSPVAQRLFIVCTPQPPSNSVLKDIFCRFGNLIEVYIMGRKTCGFAKYSDKDSANRAIEVLNGQEIGGSTLKVVHAEPEVQRKRSRMGD